MNGEYRSELISRITKLNCTNKIYIRRLLRSVALVAVFIFLGVLLFLPFAENEALPNIVARHLCGFYKEQGIIDCIRSTLSFAAFDFIVIMLMFFTGYTMIARGTGSILLIILCLRGGFICSCMYHFLVDRPIISGGAFAFSLFCLCKLLVLSASIFMFLEAESFSYKYKDMYGKLKSPLTSRESTRYMITAASSAGFTVLINTIYLIFQSLQNHTLI